jgi:hypothetical protein
MNYLVSTLLKIHTPHHTQIQRQITDYFARCGYESRTEKTVWRDRTGRKATKGSPAYGRGNVFAQKGGYTVGIEIDDCAIRMNSIEKLNALQPSLAVFVLKGHKYNWKKTYARFKYLKVKSLVVHLQSVAIVYCGFFCFQRFGLIDILKVNVRITPVL